MKLGRILISVTRSLKSKNVKRKKLRYAFTAR